MVGYYKHFEHSLRSALDTPIKLMEVLRAGQNAQKQRTKAASGEAQPVKSRDPRAISIEYAIGEDLTKASMEKLKIFDSLFQDKESNEEDMSDPFDEDSVYSGLSCEFYLFRDLHRSGFSQADPKDPLS